LYDLQGALHALTDLTWLVKQHKNDIKAGDTVYLWEGGSDAGIVAIAKVTAGPALRGENKQEADFNRDATKFAGEQLRVLLRVERVLKNRIKRADLRTHSILQNMTILKAPQGTSFGFRSPMAPVRLLRLIRTASPICWWATLAIGIRSLLVIGAG
jgi:EVE domain